MQNDSTVYVGLDVHKESIVAAYAIGWGEVVSLGNIGVLERDIVRVCTRMQSKGGSVVFVYEAGPCGYGLHRLLTKQGFACTVCAPSLLARKPGDRVKTDRRDAIMLVKALRMGDVAAVHVPDVEDEAMRDLVRAWGTAKQDLRRARQRLKSFLLAHTVRYSGRADWGPSHRRWLSEFVFASAWSQLAFEEHRRTIEDRLAQCERLEKALREATPQWHFQPVLDAIQALRGVSFTTAISLLAEIGDLSGRFGRGFNATPGTTQCLETPRGTAVMGGVSTPNAFVVLELRV